MRLVRVRSGTNPKLAAEIYYDPAQNMAWERLPMRPPWWLMGNTHDHRRLDGAAEELELARIAVINETRDRATIIERKTLLMTAMRAMDAIAHTQWTNDVLSIMCYYLLALYPAIIPEPMTAVARLVAQTSKWGQIPSYDFRGLHIGRPARKKVHHSGDPCKHFEYGEVYIDGVPWSVERCSFHPTFCVRMRDSGGAAHVLPNAYVDAMTD